MYLKDIYLNCMIIKSIIVFIIICHGVQAKDVELYGSFRIQAESVRPDIETSMNSYTAFRDAYSRLGIKAQHQTEDNLTIYSQFEIPLDLPNKEIQGVWDQEEMFASPS